MTEEEKKAIKFLESRIQHCEENSNICDENDYDEEAEYLRKEKSNLEIILNLIQTLQEYIKDANKLINKLALEIYLITKENGMNLYKDEEDVLLKFMKES